MPKFSIRQLLLVMFLFGLLAACAANAWRGGDIGRGLLWGLVMMAIPLKTMALFYWMGVCIQLVFNFRRMRQALTSQPAESPTIPPANSTPS